MKKETIIQKEAEKLFKLLEVTGEVSVTQLADGVEVVLSTEDTGMVIGHHGDILESLQLVLSLCVSKKLGEFVRVSLEVGDYKKNRTDWLETLASQTKERAIAENREVALSNLKSWERRVVHLLLQEDKEVMSESIGEGKDRTLVVKPRV